MNPLIASQNSPASHDGRAESEVPLFRSAGTAYPVANTGWSIPSPTAAVAGDEDRDWDSIQGYF